MIPEKELHALVETHAHHISELKLYRQEDRRLIERHDEQIGKLDNTMSELKERFGLMATHKDVQALSEKIDHSINGLLKDALAAVPGKVSLFFAAIVALIAVGTFIMNLTHYLK